MGNYFPVGIYLGIPAELLQLFDDIDAFERSQEVLYQWRMQYFLDEQTVPNLLSKSGVSKLVVALLMCGRHDLLNMVVKVIMSDESCDGWRVWLDEYRVDQNRHSFKQLLKKQKFDPFEDAFLYITATKLVAHSHIFLQLKVKNADVILKQSKNLERCAFEVLLKARQKDESTPPVKSLKILINTIRENKINTAILELGKLVQLWHSDMMDRLKDGNQGESTYSVNVLNEVKHIFRNFQI